MRKKRQTPIPALVVMMLMSALLVPLILSSGDDAARRSADTTATWLPGGETSSRSSGGNGRTTVCEDAPVEFSVGGTRYRETTLISSEECLVEGSEQITISYDPDDPRDFSTQGRQTTAYRLAAGAAGLGSLLALGAIVRRVVLRVRSRSSSSEDDAAARS